MARRYRVEWAPIGASDLEGIVRFKARADGPAAARRTRERILSRAGSLASYPSRGRVVPEIKAIGLTAYRELIEAPYRILYRTTGKVVGIAGVLDARRDIAELLVTRAVTGVGPENR